jgi:hypothetical protein
MGCGARALLADEKCRAATSRAALLACSEEADQNRTRGGGEDSAPFTDSYVVHSM